MARPKASEQKQPVVQQTESSEKLNAVKMAMEQIERQYGRGSIMKFGEA